MPLRLSRWLASCLVCLLSISYLVWAQQDEGISLHLRTADSLRSSGQFDLALQQYDFILESTDINTITTGALIGKADVLFSKRKIEASDSAFQVALDHQLTYLKPTNFSLLRTYAMLGYLNRYFNQNEKLAIFYYQKEYAILSGNSDLASERQKFYNNYNLATTYRVTLDFEMALNHAFQGLMIANGSGNNQYLELSYAVIANIYNTLNEDKKAIPYYEKKIELNVLLNGSSHPTLINDYNNLGVVYVDIGELDKAEKLFRKSLVVALNKTANLEALFNTYLLLGKVVGLKGDLQAGLQLFRESYEMKISKFEESRVFSHVAQLFGNFGQLDSALVYYQKALFIKSDNFYDLPDQNLVQQTPYFFRVLNDKASTLLKKYQYDKNIAPLEAALNTYRLIQKAALYHRSLFTTEEARLFFQEFNHGHNEQAIESIYLMYQATGNSDLIDEAWNIFEETKSLNLFESVKKSQLYSDLDISDSIVQSENKVIREIAGLRNQLNACEISLNCDQSEVGGIRSQLLNAENAHHNLKKQLEREFPNYFNATYNSQILSIADVQYSINQELMISFFQGEKAIYWISLDNNEKRMGKIVLDEKLLSAQSRFMAEVNGQQLKSTSFSQSFNDYQETAHFLYQKLLYPILSNDVYTSIVILPDGNLSQLPFEALIKSKYTRSGGYNYASLDYLIKSYEINYAYSASLFIEQCKVADISNPSIVAFGEPDNPAYQNLPGTRKELDEIGRLRSSKIFNKSEASEAAFIESSEGNFDILHMALHATSDTLNPMNAGLILSNDTSSLEDGVLHLHELYGIPIPAKLVVLTACETGLGQWQKGEGILSLSRGFIYNDNPNLIMSLWKLNDQQSAKLVQSFYNSFYSGTSIGSALRTAKIDLIEAGDELTSHPSNWAGLVYLGNPDFKITNQRFASSKIVYWTIAIVLIGVVLLSKRKWPANYDKPFS